MTTTSTRLDARRLRTVVEDAWRVQVHRITELSLLLHEPADADPESRGVLTRWLSDARRSLEELEAALARLGDGSYGHCTACGRGIPFEQLEAAPGTERCQRCRPQ